MMKNGKFQRRGAAGRSAGKSIAVVLVLVLVLGCAIGGTIAWLTDKTDEVKNTFTVGDINIDLTETFNTDTNDDDIADAWTGHIIPGTDLAKDPKVTVDAGSEKCWVFVKVTEENWPEVKESDNTTRKISYSIRENWVELENATTEANTKVYYYKDAVDVSSATEDWTYYVLDGTGTDDFANGYVHVSDTLTKTELNAITTSPKLIFTAYASQYVNGSSSFTAAQAWENVTP